MKSAARLRLFVALELPPAWQQSLAALSDSLKDELARDVVRWVRPGGIHLTLKFYGEVRPEVVPALDESVRHAAAQSGPLTLNLSGLGVFPSPRAPRVVWVGVAGDLRALTGLQQAVEDGAAAHGFAPEARGFSPHLTLGRISGRLSMADSQKLQGLLAQPFQDSAGPATFTHLSLIRSELRGPGGAQYTQMLTAPLGGRAL